MSTDPDGDALTYAWDLDGDGAFDDSTAANPTHTYTTNGSVNVRLRVTDSHNATNIASVTVNVGGGAGTPVPMIGFNTQNWYVGQSINFSGVATTRRRRDTAERPEVEHHVVPLPQRHELPPAPPGGSGRG